MPYICKHNPAFGIEKIVIFQISRKVTVCSFFDCKRYKLTSASRTESHAFYLLVSALHIPYVRIGKSVFDFPKERFDHQRLGQKAHTANSEISRVGLTNIKRLKVLQSYCFGKQSIHSVLCRIKIGVGRLKTYIGCNSFEYCLCNVVLRQKSL